MRVAVGLWDSVDDEAVALKEVVDLWPGSQKLIVLLRNSME